MTRELGEDAIATAEYFASRKRINHVHYRNVQVVKPYEKYQEVFIDAGVNDMFGVMKALIRNKYTGTIYPEHPRALDVDRERVGRLPGYPGGGRVHRHYIQRRLRARHDAGSFGERLRMAVIVSMLRGVNVGGHNMIKMDALCALYESLGLRKVETFIQSGNVIFTTQARDRTALTKRIEDAIEKKFGFHADLVLRNAAELRDTLARNPFADRLDIDPAKILIVFLASDPDPEGCAKVRALDIAPEELHIDGREVYVYFANGMARPKTRLASNRKADENSRHGPQSELRS